MAPPPTVNAYRSLWNHRRSYTMKPRKLCFFTPFLPLPKQATPLPLSHPASIVTETADLSRKLSGASRYFTSMLSSVCQRVRVGAPSVSRPIPYWFPRIESQPFGRHRICPPRPGRLLNCPYDCQPLINHGSIFSFFVGKICTRTPLKNHGVFEETYEG